MSELMKELPKVKTIGSGPFGPAACAPGDRVPGRDGKKGVEKALRANPKD